MNQMLIASFDMEIGGVERSLVSLLNNFNYEDYNVDLMLYSHTGELMHLLPKETNVLSESESYKTFRMPVSQIIKSGELPLALSRILAKWRVTLNRSSESGYKQMQYMWRYALPFLPVVSKKYNVAISYLWPHYFVAEKVQATTKIAWIHTDFSTVETDINMDLAMWEKFNYIVAVSVECKKAFLNKYPTLTNKVVMIENITSPTFVRELAKKKIENPLESDQRFKVITVARLSHAKGIDRAVKALKLLHDQGHDDVVWYVVGYGGDEALIEQLIMENDLVDSFILLGKQINPYPFMKTADLYVQPSRYEGKAVTVSEAQILAKPVLITNYPTAKSQIKNGFDGIICDLSIEGIADGIVKLMNDHILRNELVNNCKNTDYHNSDELNKLYELV